MNEMAEAFLRWPLPDDVCADDCACKAGAPNRTGTNLLTAHQALAMIRFVCRPELTAMYADVERLSAELAALRAERDRLLNWVKTGPHQMGCASLQDKVPRDQYGSLDLCNCGKSTALGYNKSTS